MKALLIITFVLGVSYSYSQNFPKYNCGDKTKFNTVQCWMSDIVYDEELYIRKNYTSEAFIKVIDLIKFNPKSEGFNYSSFKNYINELSTSELFKMALKGDSLRRTKLNESFYPNLYNKNYHEIDKELWNVYCAYILPIMELDGILIQDNKKLVLENSSSKSNSSDKFGDNVNIENWEIKGIKKVEMKNSKTNNWDQIFFLNPGKYIEIKNEKDLRITDLDILSTLFGTYSVGLYQSAVFENGKLTQTNKSQTKFYLGDLVLSSENKFNEKTGKAGVYFMWGNGQKLLELRNDICKCYVRFYYSDEYGFKNLD